MSICFYTHFHRDFPFNFESSWVKACYAGGTGAYEWHPPSEKGPFTNVTVDSEILKYKHYYFRATEEEFLRAIGQQVTDSYVANLSFEMPQYVGVGSYRRYLYILDAENNPHEKVVMPANEESGKYLTSDEQKEAALKILETSDVIINRARTINISIEEQYLQSQPPEYWNLFKQAIVQVNPLYEKHMSWFTKPGHNTISYEGVYIMRKDLYQNLMREYFQIMEYIWFHCSNAYPTTQTTSEPLPWRYPGFLNERFVPFFVFANSLQKTEVPLVFLG